MNPTNYDQLRWCDRYKSTIVDTHVEAFAKKIRKRKNFESGIINANTEQKQIDVFYKQGWQYQHAHTSLCCDITDPIYIQQKSDQTSNDNLSKYYEDCKNFIQRLKTQHEDQTAFRVQARWVQPLIAIESDQLHSNKYSARQKRIFQNLACSKQVYKNFIFTIEDAVKNMGKNLEKYKSMDQLQNEEYAYLNIKQILNVLSGWLEALKSQNNQNISVSQWLQQEHVEQITSMNQFMTNFIQIAQQIRQEKRSCVFNYQPEISVLTHIIHPVLLSLSGLYWKQRITWRNQYEHNPFNIDYNVHIPSTPLLEDIPHHEISKTIFINLDGYQSQFNIQLSKNLQNHLMYISFPILEPNNMHHSTFNTRFYKKIMFNTSRQLYEYQCEDFDVVYSNGDIQGMDMDTEQMDIRRQLQLKNDPQKYFQQISKIYKDKSLCQSNKNLYILPLRFKYLQQELSTLFIDKNIDASNYSSYFIWYMLKSFLFQDMRKFDPTHIVISYSGILQVLDQHWVGILQVLAQICQRKMIFFGNFTSKFTENLKQEYQYDNFVTTNVSIQNTCNIDLMNKMSQFLKISSGTYNLQKPYTPENLIPRYKMSKVNTYIRGLLNALSSQQYPHLKNRISQIFLRVDSIIVNRSIDQNKKQIKNSIPSYYQQLFRYIRHILLNQSNKFPQQLTDYVEKLRNQIRMMANGLSIQSRDRYADQIVRSLELGVVSQKFSEVAYVYFKSRPDRIQYQQIKQQINEQNQEETSKTSTNNNNNLQDLYSLSLRYTTQSKQKQTLLITPQTELHYRSNQTHKFRTNTTKKLANIILINNLKDNQFISYAGVVSLVASNQMEKNRHKIHNQRVEMFPIVFNGMPELDWSGWSVRAGWNYAETSRYYFLYWPVQYNILQAKLKSISQQPYSPRILNQIYISQIPQTKQHRLIFNRATLTDTTTIPRRYCTTLQLMQQNKIFILGGFYDREYNYLALQTEITGLDLSHYDNQNRKCVVTNQKGTMYQLQGLEKGKNNSYVRARRQYQVFQLEELCRDLRQEQLQAQNQIRTYIMIGGYGQNFVRPYSLINCFYYQINVDLQTKSIKSIERNYLYQKLLTCNIKGYIKNNNFFQRLALYQKNILKPNQILSPQSYIAHRSIYSLAREQKQGKIQQQLHIKTKYLFAINLYSNIKNEYQKIALRIGQYIDTKTNDTSQFLLSLSNLGNHYLTIRKNKDHQQTIQIYLQKMQSKTTYQHVPLIHGNIISIDIKFKYIYAIVKHDKYTNGKYVLTQCQMPSQQSDVVLKIIHVFVENLEQFTLFAPRPTEVLLLHGATFDHVAIYDFIFKINKKQGGKQLPIKKIQHPNYISSKKYKKCYTVLLKDQNKQTKSLQIQQINILFPQQNRPKSYTLRKSRLKMLTTSQFTWQPTTQYPIIFLQQSTKTPIYILRIQSTRILQQQQQLHTSFYSLSSSMLSSLCGYNQENVVLVKIWGFSNRGYIGVVNMDQGRVKEMTQDGVVTVFVVSCENSDVRRIWDIAMPIQYHVKSLNKYKDMEII